MDLAQIISSVNLPHSQEGDSLVYRFPDSFFEIKPDSLFYTTYNIPRSLAKISSLIRQDPNHYNALINSLMSSIQEAQPNLQTDHATFLINLSDGLFNDLVKLLKTYSIATLS